MPEKTTPTYEYEHKAYDSGFKCVCGIDEAGRGPLAGPVFAAAVVLPVDCEIPGLNDSKKLTEKKRDALFEVIIEKAIAYSVASASEIRVQLAENRPQRQVQERLREYIIIKMEDFIMAKRGGFPGGMPGNMNNLMKQAQKMQKQMAETTKALEEKSYEASAGGGVVSVTVSGKKEVTAIKIAEEVVDPDDIEMLEDLIMAATNEAFRAMEADSQAQMSKLTGGLGGGFGF